MENQQLSQKEKRAITKKKYYEEHKCVVICECGCQMSNYGMSKHLKSNKHVMMMAGATEEECKRYDCGKASVTNCIKLLRDDNLEPRLFLIRVNELRKLLIEYEGYQKNMA